MATLNPPKSISKRQELRQDTAVTVYVKAQEFFYENRTLVYGVAAGLIVVLLAIAGYAWLQSQKAVEAQEQLGGIVTVYEKGEYRAALDGTGEHLGLLAIADEYGGTDAGNLARFYAADALFRLGEYDQALEFFQAYDKGEDIVGASALAGEATIHEIKGDHALAGNLYRQAAGQFENEMTSPQYLMAAGRAYEQAGQYDNAGTAYQTIQDSYPESTEAQNIDFYLARVRAAQR